MKKFILIVGLLLLLAALGLRAYFALVPPPPATLERPLAEIVPSELEGWNIRDLDIAQSLESSARISDFLNFDDYVFRTFQQGDTTLAVYIAYWSPGKASYRWAGAHTPDTCWVLNGWTRLDRQYSVPFACGPTVLEPAEFGIYEKNNEAQNVYFWHLIGGNAFSYQQKGTPNIFGALVDIKAHGLNLRQEQFFIRLSSNRDLAALKQLPGFSAIVESLQHIGLDAKAP